MKVNEIVALTEAPYGALDKAKNALGSLFGTDAAKGRAAVGREANDTAAEFRQYVTSSGGNPSRVDGSALVYWLTNKRKPNYPISKDIVPNGVLNAKMIDTAIMQTIQADIAGGIDAWRALQGGTEMPAPQQTAPQQTAPQRTSTSTAAPAKLAKGVEIVNQEPIIIRFGGVTFTLGDTGTWIQMKSRKPAPPDLSAFLDQQHDIILG